MAIFGLGVSVFGIIALTNKVILPSIKAADGSVQFAERVVWRRLLVKLSPNEIMKLSAA
jgi:hypothetical protein